MEKNEQNKSKTIAKNTLFLYFRMMLIMLVSLYTSRVVLEKLGETDFGIYNVVAGFVSMFALLTGSLSAAISRFITYELGKGNKENLKKIFSLSLTIQFSLSIVVILVGELVGVWFLNTRMTIPAERLFAANWVFQLSLLGFCFHMISIPYNAAIIAHEHMKAFAFVGIIDAFARLMVVFLLAISPIDMLIFYAVLLCLISIFIRSCYSVYCHRHFAECSFSFCFDSVLFKQLASFAGWNFIGSSASLLREQGGNVIINLFFNPAVNAARGIAAQANTAIHSFVSNFMTALNPQITKSYASGNTDYMMKLVFQGARLSYFMLLLLSLPIIFSTDYILSIWLVKVPEKTSIFFRLVLFFGLSESLSHPLVTTMLATGRIKKYQLTVGGLQLLNLPFSYFFLRCGFPAETVLYVALFFSQCCLFMRLIMLKSMVGLNIKAYMENVYLKVLFVTLFSLLVPTFFVYFYEVNSFGMFILESILCLISTLFYVLYIGCSIDERSFVYRKLKELTHKIL
ncbi:MAG: lipopolysaccharide biosynthesis protein [Paludibacteraceae bacterium]|nr:lipopolysaccharide biosynthesis protein [Paludibacteraceae bacterium]